MKLVKLTTGLIIDLEDIGVVIPVDRDEKEDLCDVFLKGGACFSYQCYEEISKLMDSLLVRRPYEH